MTLNDILHWGEARFIKANLYFGHGTDNAWDEAVWIALSVLKLPPDADKRFLKQMLTPEQMERIKKLYQRRITERVPAAYLVQETWFAGLPFYVDQRVIIPRSPMAELIENRFNLGKKARQIGAILDLCTGSGCIAVACAKAFPTAHIDAVDISPEALEVAQINVDKHQVNSQISLIPSDLFQQLGEKKYDLIVSNPPYVNAADLAALPQEYRWEPELALAAGQDGLRLVDIILKEAKNYLLPSGKLIVEVGNSHLALRKKYPHLPFRWIPFKRGEAEVFALTYEALSDEKLS